MFVTCGSPTECRCVQWYSVDSCCVYLQARLWIQMMRELRQGVSLKKVEQINHHHSMEYELTPYEILMEDIRCRRYTLKQVMVSSAKLYFVITSELRPPQN